MPAIGEPALSCAPAPRTDHVLGLGSVNRLERLVEPAQRLDGRRQLVVMRRVLLDVLDQARRVRHLRPPVAGHVPSNMDEVAEVRVEDEPTPRARRPNAHQLEGANRRGATRGWGRER